MGCRGSFADSLVTPGFASDCLESLYDIKSVACDFFCTLCSQNDITADVTYIPCLNHREDHIDLLFNVVKKAIESIDTAEKPTKLA